MARPKKDLAEQLTKPVSFRLTEADYAAYLGKVETSGMKPADFFRDCVLTNRTQIIAKPKVSTDKARLLYLFNKASNNINQLAYRANSDHAAGAVGEKTYAGILRELQTLNNYLKATLKNVD